MRDYEEETRETIKVEIERLRATAGQIANVKKIVREFDGKMYNCRFDEAIKELNDEDNYFYCFNQYGWFYIKYQYKHTYSKTTDLLVGYSTKDRKERYETEDKYKIFTENKRIIADKMIEGLNRKYASLLQEAAELEKALENIEVTIAQINQIKELYCNLVSSVPSLIIDTYRVKRMN